MDGRVLWTHPDLIEGGKLARQTVVATVGSMDPMLLRAQVHEVESVALHDGDAVAVSLATDPEAKLTGSVSRVSWTPVGGGIDQPAYYEVDVRVANPDLRIREGYQGTAILQRPPGGAKAKP
jgi:hypothetical protein